jgi:hypothetical protein
MIKNPQPIESPTSGSGSGQGMKELDTAIAVLGQINVLIPIGIALGRTLVDLIQNRASSGGVTVEEAKAAIAGFRQVSTQVRQSTEEWLDTHPRTEE